MEHSKNTKEQILDVSLKLFAEKSYHGASIRDIAKEIDKRESSIYNHFKSKKEILEEIITKFISRNFGKIVLTDKLINIISKPEKFFLMLAENLIEFWNTENERMFIIILMNRNSIEGTFYNYTLEMYLDDFRNLCEFIFEEMMKHKFIDKFNVKVLSSEFTSPLFLLQLELLFGHKILKEQKLVLKNHVEFFWKAIKK